MALAPLVEPRIEQPRAVVLGIPRGGVIVARALADALALPLDVVVVRKLGVPGHEEYGFGAIGEDGVVIVDEATVATLRLSGEEVAAVERRERAELERRVAAYTGDRNRADLVGTTVVIVDDGIATGGTIRAAIAACRARGATEVIVAVGVAPPQAIESLAREADDAIAAMAPRRMTSVGEWFDDFAQTTDGEVLAALAR